MRLEPRVPVLRHLLAALGLLHGRGLRRLGHVDLGGGQGCDRECQGDSAVCANARRVVRCDAYARTTDDSDEGRAAGALGGAMRCCMHVGAYEGAYALHACSDH